MWIIITLCIMALAAEFFYLYKLISTGDVEYLKYVLISYAVLMVVAVIGKAIY